MCGRFTLTADGDTLVREFGFAALAAWSPRYNIAPGQPVVALLGNDAGAPAAWLKWGLIPFWAKDAAIGNRLINARGETVADKPAFRAAFKHRRCVVLADGYFEWAGTPRGKQPYYVKPCAERVVGIAALWERWRDPGGDCIESCTLITTRANRRLAEIHARMPVFLSGPGRAAWLDAAAPEAALLECLAPPPDDAFDARPVSRLVNSPANDLPACIEPVATTTQG